MMKWITGILLAFLLIDHVWVHYGGPLAERLRGQYREELKRNGPEKEKVSSPQPYRRSILEEAWGRIEGMLKRGKE